MGVSGIKVVTREYTDYVWLHNDFVDEACAEGVHFVGRAGWIRRLSDGTVMACLADGELIQAFGRCFERRGPWSYNLDGSDV